MLLVKHGTIVDGTGGPGFKKDLLLSGNRIAAIGDFSGKKNIETIDALGGVITPGFIDIHGTIDHHLTIFSDPAQEHYLRQGVTTVIGGHCGASLAPLINGSLVAIKKWSDIDQINVNWENIKELRARLARQRLGINFGTLVGYNGIRRAFVGDAERNLSDRELAMATKIIEIALQQGAMGVSTGLGYIHENTTPYNEIKAIVSIVAREGKLYTTHLRDEYIGLHRALQETIAVTEETGATTLINHWNARRGEEAVRGDALAQINTLTKKTKLYMECTPGTISVIPIYMLLPLWARQNNHERIESALNIRRADLVTVIHAPKYDSIVGKTLETIAKNRETEATQALLDIIRLTKGNALVAWKNINATQQRQMMEHTRTLIGGGDAMRIGAMPFTEYRAWSDARKKPIEQTIAKITGVPATIGGINKRGKIKEGYCADLVIMHKNTIHDVIVNGIHEVRSGKVIAANAGEIL